MSMSRWRPSNDLLSLRDAMNRLFEDSFLRSQGSMDPWAGSGNMPVDVYEEGDNLIVKASLPGIKPEDLNIEVRDNMLNISAETKQEQEHKEQNYILREQRFGQMRRSVPLPYDVQTDQAQAELDGGMLTLTLPKAEAAKSKQIPVKPKTNAENK